MLYCQSNHNADQTMHDLTEGSISKQIIRLSLPISVGLVLQTLYFIIDLYFVAELGEQAVAGVGIAGNLNFLIIALTQIFNVGVTALISQAVGRKAQGEALDYFNQALLLCSAFTLATLIFGYSLADTYMQHLSDDIGTQAAGKTYLWWFLPNMALQFAMTVMMAALRGTGVVKPTMIVQLISVILNIILAPVLISGWLTGVPLGVAGAGLASSIAAVVGFIMLAIYFKKSSRFLKINLKNLTPDFQKWQRIIAIGFPSGAEFILMFAYISVVYWALQKFGPHAQAGFGIGNRIMQSLMMPTLAISFATPALIGQNFGAGKAQRVQDIFHTVLKMNLILMLIFGAVCILASSHLMEWFTEEQGVITIGSIYLTWIGWNFIPSSVVMACNGVYQGLGNTWPALFCSLARIAVVVVGIWLLYPLESFSSEHIWQLSLAATVLQAGLTYYLLRQLMLRKLSVIPISS